ncbi:MAG: ExbD/TolR family protein [Myxococcota bacterium]
MSAKPRTQLKPEINVTPLVDVVLVLLIIFMVIAPQLEAGEAVELAKAKNVAREGQMEALTLTLTASGRMLVERDVVDEDGLLRRLTAEHAKSEDRPLVIKVDRSLTYGKARALFATARGIGFSGVSLTVDEKVD